MSNSSTFEEGGYGKTHWWIAALLLLGLIWLTLIGCSPWGDKCGAAKVATAPAVVPAAPIAAPAPAPVAAPAPAVAATPAAAPAATSTEWARIDSVPAAKVYFALDKTDVPADTDKTLSEVVAYLKANEKANAYISGFHDPTGNQAHNEDLALNRARHVRDALGKLGIPKERTQMQKPASTTGSGDNKEARRVEVSVWAPK